MLLCFSTFLKNWDVCLEFSDLNRTITNSALISYTGVVAQAVPSLQYYTRANSRVKTYTRAVASKTPLERLSTVSMSLTISLTTSLTLSASMILAETADARTRLETRKKFSRNILFPGAAIFPFFSGTSDANDDLGLSDGCFRRRGRF